MTEAADILQRSRARVDPALRAAVATLDAHNGQVAEYHLGYRDQLGVPGAVGGGGKMVRGALALLSARAAGGAEADAVPAAVGVELVHQYSLLHDDIIDNDTSRRHRPSAWTIFGQGPAILAGDAMAALAIEVALNGSAPGVGVAVAASLARATRLMVAGQAMDLTFERSMFVPLDECIAMAEAKTGALIHCAVSIGALAVGADEELVEALTSFGRHVGLAFQLIDDLIGLWGDPARTGKPVGSDIVARKVSLPVAAALAAGGQHADTLAAIYAQQRTPSQGYVAQALAAIESAGGRWWAQSQADKETELALAALDSISMDAATRSELAALTSMLCRRDN